MSGAVKSLPLQEVREIFTALRKLEAMSRELGRDLERGSRELSANSGDQFLRRNLVRIFAAFVEGYSFTLKQVVLRLHEPLHEELSANEMAKLKEIKLDCSGNPLQDENGDAKRCYLPLLDNFKFTFATFGRLCGRRRAVSYNSSDYLAFKRTISVRDRLMHPKDIQDLVVTNSETMDLQAAWQWYQSEMVSLMKDSNDAIKARFADILEAKNK